MVQDTTHRHQNGERSSKRVAIIGAGSAGLAVAHELLKEGHEVTLLEHARELGGSWRVEPPGPRTHSSMYSGLRTNLPRGMMTFLEYPFHPDAMGDKSKDPRPFPGQAEVLSYYEAFADVAGLRQLIRYNTKVLRIDPIPVNGASLGGSDWDGATAETAEKVLWRVRSAPAAADGGAELAAGADEAKEGEEAEVVDEVYDAVVGAVGHHSVPNTPELPGLDVFPGLQLHSHDYRGPEPFRGLNVVVVGASYSGEEMARSVANVAAHVYHSARTWTGQGLPGSGKDGGSDVRPVAAPQPRDNLTRVAMVTSLGDDGSVTLKDGRRLEGVGAVLWCTGYHYSYPWMEHLKLVTTDDFRVTPLYLHMFVPRYAPSLALVGLSWRASRVPQFQLQGQLIARALSGRAQLPSPRDMLADEAKWAAAMQAKGIPLRFAHCMALHMPQDERAYDKQLSDLAGPGALVVPAWFWRLVDAFNGSILNRPETFRDEWLPEEIEKLAESDAELRAMAKAWNLLHKEGYDYSIASRSEV